MTNTLQCPEKDHAKITSRYATRSWRVLINASSLCCCSPARFGHELRQGNLFLKCCAARMAAATSVFRFSAYPNPRFLRPKVGTMRLVPWLRP